MAKTKIRSNIDPEFFVKFWNQSDSVDNFIDMIETAGFTHSGRVSLLARANYYRRKGVTLKALVGSKGRGPGRSNLDVERLNQIAKSVLEMNTVLEVNTDSSKSD